MKAFTIAIDFISGGLAIAALVALVMGSPWFPALAAIPVGTVTGTFLAKLLVLITEGVWVE